MSSFKARILIATAVLTAVAFCLLWTRQDSAETSSSSGAAGVSPSDDDAPQERISSNGSGNRKGGPPAPGKEEENPLLEPDEASETAINSVLAVQSRSNQDKVDDLIRILPKCNLGGQMEAADHLSNLVEDADLDRIMQLLGDKKLFKETRQELFDDLFNRPPEVTLPLLMQVAQGNTDFVDEALESLQQLLGEDHGKDLQAWQEAVDMKMKRLPKPPASGK